MSHSILCHDVTECVGKTPLVELHNVTRGLDARIAVKLDYMNPAGSVKDRVGRAMIVEAEEKGLIKPGVSVLIAPTGGNLGIALALAAKKMGYKLIVTMPSNYSVERRTVLKAYDAEVTLTDPELGLAEMFRVANELAEVIPSSLVLNQFDSPANVAAHYATTGPEIWSQTNGKVDILCIGCGSGGTLTGAGRFLREKKADIAIYAVEPFESSVLNGFPAGPHRIQGMGAGIVPPNLDCSLFSEALRVHSDDAIVMARRLASEESILGGISSGANVCAAIELAKRPENAGKLIVTMINSFGERYISTDLYATIQSEAEKMAHQTIEESIAVALKYVNAYVSACRILFLD